jgi:FixJ family two-component response regulator
MFFAARVPLSQRTTGSPPAARYVFKPGDNRHVGEGIDVLGMAGAVHLIDDDPDFRRGLERLLRAHGMEVKAFESAEEFLAQESPEEAGCLILDIHLGGISGIELRRRLAKNPGFNIPVVFVTAIESQAIRDAAVEAGCIAVLQKPFPGKALMDVVARALAPEPMGY